MQNTTNEYSEYSEYHPLEIVNDFNNDPPHENESAPLLTHPPLIQRTVSQQNNNFSIHKNLQMISNSINEIEENVNRQLEQVNELRNLLNQIRQFIIAQQQQPPPSQQQQPSVPRRVYRPRPHPYLNERPSVRTPTIRSATPAYRRECFTTEQLASSNSLLHHQQTNVPADTADNNEIFSSDIQNYGFCMYWLLMISAF
ncbi:hypothetical protein RclHR1_04790009 [Rhizophagus clarus]|uniref:Uncharacterized protein n=1 Tax=Rhizophagus clarus TaxID=94130 RepID=A0A2Z6S0V8_9GLOM|nr:hypothetical protein RclHR1_04790009 [Rhizophagus clarus]